MMQQSLISLPVRRSTISFCTLLRRKSHPSTFQQRNALWLTITCMLTIPDCFTEGTNQWRYRGRCDSIQFIVDRRIFVAGYGLYGSSTGQSRYNVRMELKKKVKRY
uniref:BTB/POZ domain-containing protein 6 n=1 Tax=Ascaris suum TaxID=6253 RepID=F1LFW6_ASCSU